MDGRCTDCRWFIEIEGSIMGLCDFDGGRTFGDARMPCCNRPDTTDDEKE